MITNIELQKITDIAMKTFSSPLTNEDFDLLKSERNRKIDRYKKLTCILWVKPESDPLLIFNILYYFSFQNRIKYVTSPKPFNKFLDKCMMASNNRTFTKDKKPRLISMVADLICYSEILVEKNKINFNDIILWSELKKL
ncbi:MAG: hypothetical protein L6Q54_01915 [Leptospiraceae bacterium]|nr:hypothetical protein [Leptospiraceae bacterium]MCK6379995.1 hypothetical protein [Leptospiraceae bacterium]NUM40162.1 hypothetical protein [Leptospiraceae bacterium]